MTAESSTESGTVIWTIGHSNRSIEDFLQLLATQAVELVADVRRFAGSRRHPHFGPLPLAAALRAAGVEYQPYPELGGRRSERLENSPNTAWRVEAFNAYAFLTEPFNFTASLPTHLVRRTSKPVGEV